MRGTLRRSQNEHGESRRTHQGKGMRKPSNHVDATNTKLLIFVKFEARAQTQNPSGRDGIQEG